MSAINAFLAQWEPLWLFSLIFGEAVVGAASLYVLIREYHYDKEWNERMQHRRDKRRKKAECEKLEEVALGQRSQNAALDRRDTTSGDREVVGGRSRTADLGV